LGRWDSGPGLLRRNLVSFHVLKTWPSPGTWVSLWAWTRQFMTFIYAVLLRTNPYERKHFREQKNLISDRTEFFQQRCFLNFFYLIQTMGWVKGDFRKFQQLDYTYKFIYYCWLHELIKKKKQLLFIVPFMH